MSVPILSFEGLHDVSPADLVAAMETLPTEAIHVALIASAGTFKLAIGTYRRQVGCALWELRRRLEEGEYGDAVAELGVATGFTPRTLHSWRQEIEKELGRAARESAPARGRPPGNGRKPENTNGAERPADYEGASKSRPGWRAPPSMPPPMSYLLAIDPAHIAGEGSPHDVHEWLREVETWAVEVRHSLASRVGAG